MRRVAYLGALGAAFAVSMLGAPAFAQWEDDAPAQPSAEHEQDVAPSEDGPSAEHATGDAAQGEHGGGGGHHDAHFNWASHLFGGLGAHDAPPFLASIINFLALCAILYFIARKPLSSFLTERRREIEEGLLESKRIKEQAEAKHRDYQERLARLDSDLAQLKKEIVAAGEKERDRIVADAESTAARMRRETEFLVEQELKQLRIDLRREIVEEAVTTAERVLRERVTDDDQRRLADEYSRMADRMLGKGGSVARTSTPPGRPS